MNNGANAPAFVHPLATAARDLIIVFFLGAKKHFAMGQRNNMSERLAVRDHARRHNLGQRKGIPAF
jgi:hypothetical protein